MSNSLLVRKKSALAALLTLATSIPSCLKFPDPQDSAFACSFYKSEIPINCEVGQARIEKESSSGRVHAKCEDEDGELHRVSIVDAVESEVIYMECTEEGILIEGAEGEATPIECDEVDKVCRPPDKSDILLYATCESQACKDALEEGR